MEYIREQTQQAPSEMFSSFVALGGIRGGQLYKFNYPGKYDIRESFAHFWMGKGFMSFLLNPMKATTQDEYY
jgi:hypothetical protein